MRAVSYSSPAPEDFRGGEEGERKKREGDDGGRRTRRDSQGRLTRLDPRPSPCSTSVHPFTADVWLRPSDLSSTRLFALAVGLAKRLRAGECRKGHVRAGANEVCPASPSTLRRVSRLHYHPPSNEYEEVYIAIGQMNGSPAKLDQLILRPAALSNACVHGRDLGLKAEPNAD